MHHSQIGKRKDLAFLMIATGRYLGYAENFYRSARLNLVEPENVRLVLFTDQPESVESWSQGDKSLEVVPIKIEPYRWPEATLLRYKVFSSHWANVNAEIVAYVDADTELVESLHAEMMRDALGHHRIGVVRHPGYFNRSWLINLVLPTPVGPWERRRRSTAHVPILKRKSYVCGGVWFGYEDEIGEMCRKLAANVELDRQRDLIAKYHDESHLNRYKIDNDVALLDPVWAFAEDYKNIKHLRPIIEVVHKPADWIRE